MKQEKEKQRGKRISKPISKAVIHSRFFLLFCFAPPINSGATYINTLKLLPSDTLPESSFRHALTADDKTLMFS